MRKKVLLRAPALVSCGYGQHSRQIFRWLKNREDQYDISIQTLPWGNCSWMLDKNLENGLVGEIMGRTAQPPKDLDISIQLQLPNEWNPKIAKFNVGITAGVETDKCNPEWIDAINKMDLIIVPSEHTKKTFESSGSVQKRIVVIPESFIDSIDNDDSFIDLKLDTDFNFLIVGQITGKNDETDRKNTYKTLKWICETFKNDKDVGIVLKTNSARNSIIDRSLTKDIVKQTLGKVRNDDNRIPPIYLIHGYMTESEMAGLYRHPKIKALVSLPKAEGYGLPILEAAASDLPVIATNWSGHLDFMNKGKFIKVDYDLMEVDKSKVDNQIFMAGSKWAEPKETAAKKALKKFRDLPEEPEKWAKELGEIIRKDYSQEAIEKKYDKIFSDIAIW